MMTVTKHSSQRDDEMFAGSGLRSPAQGNQTVVAVIAASLLFAFASQVSAQAMSTSLRMSSAIQTNNGGSIPANDPYCGAGGQFSSVSPCEDVTLSLGVGAGTLNSSPLLPADVVDWVLVELREAATAGAAAAGGAGVVKARKPALLLSNGRVVDAEAFVGISAPTISGCNDVDEDEANCPAVSFGEDSFMDGNVPTTFPGSGMNAYVVVRHRNHLPVMSANAVAISSSAGGYHFNSVSSGHGGVNALKTKNSTAVMIAGDADGNGLVQPADINAVIEPAQGGSGYLSGDVSMNTLVQPADINTVAQPNQGSASQVSN